MGTYQYPNLTIVQENEDSKIKCNILQKAIVALSPNHDEVIHVTREQVHNTIEQQFHTSLHPHNIAIYGSKFLIQPHTQHTRNQMLAQGYLKTTPRHLALIPWTPDHGSTKVAAHTQPFYPMHSTHNEAARAANKPKKHV